MQYGNLEGSGECGKQTVLSPYNFYGNVEKLCCWKEGRKEASMNALDSLASWVARKMPNGNENTAEFEGGGKLGNLGFWPFISYKKWRLDGKGMKIPKEDEPQNLRKEWPMENGHAHRRRIVPKWKEVLVELDGME